MTKLEELHFDNHDYRDAAEVTKFVAEDFLEWCYDNNVSINKEEGKLVYLYKEVTYNLDEIFNIFMNE